jgi:hypothetical protein
MYSPFNSQQFSVDITYFNSFWEQCHSFEADQRGNKRNCVELVIFQCKIVTIVSTKELLIADLIGAA